MNEFQENTKSYCRRIQADCEQLKYLTDILIFLKDPDRKQHYVDRMEEVMKRIQEHMEKL